MILLIVNLMNVENPSMARIYAISLSMLYVGVHRYRGYVPTMKFDYAETYSNHTAKYFQDYRSRVLETSKNNYNRGGYFPSYYSYNGNVAVEARTRKWDHWLQSPHYRLTNVDHDRKEELINFAKVL